MIAGVFIRRTTLFASTLVAGAVLISGCDAPALLGGVDCEGLSSAGWKTLAEGDRQDEASAIKDCGTIEGKTREETIAWMGRPAVKIGNQDSWIIGMPANDLESDLPTLTAEYGDDGTVRKIYVNGK